MLHGFDVSAFQGATAPSGDFDFIKATEGSGYTSSKFGAQYASAKSRAKVRGAYHFARPEQSSAKSQCRRFLDVVQPVRGEVAWLDLEASKLNQADTNRWARDFGDELWSEADWLATGAYLGRGYVANNTGRDLSQHFNLWWFPQYPSKYLLARVRHLAMRARGIHPRSADAPRKVPIARAASLWPPNFTPSLPSVNTTGWSRPHIWQFTDNFNGLDASVSWLPLDQLAHGGHAPVPQPTPSPTPQEEDMPYGGQLPAGKGAKANISFPHGAEKAIGLVYDNPKPAEVRVAFHHKAGSGEVYDLKVGGPASTTDSWPRKTVQAFKTPADGDWVSLTRLDDGTDPVGWDMS